MIQIGYVYTVYVQVHKVQSLQQERVKHMIEYGISTISKL